MKVGFIGLGHMGAGMAANLLKAGHEVTVYNRTRAKAEPLVKGGAREAATIANACRGDAVFSRAHFSPRLCQTSPGLCRLGTNDLPILPDALSPAEVRVR